MSLTIVSIHCYLNYTFVLLATMSGSLYTPESWFNNLFFFSPPLPLGRLISGKRSERLLQLCSKSKSPDSLSRFLWPGAGVIRVVGHANRRVDRCDGGGSSFTPITLDHIRGRTIPPDHASITPRLWVILSSVQEARVWNIVNPLSREPLLMGRC